MTAGDTAVSGVGHNGRVNDMAQQLAGALDRGELDVWYQPASSPGC